MTRFNLKFEKLGDFLHFLQPNFYLMNYVQIFLLKYTFNAVTIHPITAGRNQTKFINGTSSAE